MQNFELNLNLEPDPDPCTGLIFKAYSNQYVTKAGNYEVKEGMKLLKRKSCKCNKCMIMLDTLHESMSNELWPIMEKIEDGKLYGLRIVNESRDWESGIVDDYDLEFFEL